jgi:hypothetical protein
VGDENGCGRWDRGTGRDYHWPVRAPASAIGLALVGCVLAAPASAATMSIGRGMPPWRLGMLYVQRPGLVRTELFSSGTRGPGCVPGVSAATRIDDYRAVRTAWFPGAGGKLRLIDVATQRAGDRSGDGFVIDVSTRGAVRRRHPGATSAYGKGRLALGASSLTVLRRTGKETFTTLTYWFDARGVLTALETFAGGC